MGYYEDLIGTDRMMALAGYLVNFMTDVGSADDNLDEKESTRIEELLHSGGYFNSPIMNELLYFIDGNQERVQKYILEVIEGGYKRASEEIYKVLETLKMLEEKVGEEKVRRFKTEFIAMGVSVASASGGGFLIKRNPISDEEMCVILLHQKMFGVSPEEVAEAIEKLGRNFEEME